MEDAGDRVGLRGDGGEQARGGQADAEARLEDGEPDDEGVAEEHRVAEPDEAAAGASGRRRRQQDGGHGDDDGDVVERGELVRRPDQTQQQPGEPERGRQEQVLGRERHGVAAQQQVADAGVDDDGEHDAEEERLRHLRQGERRAEQREHRQGDEQRREDAADGGAREALAAEHDDRHERDEHQQTGGGEQLARGRRRDHRGEDGAAADQRGVGGGEASWGAGGRAAARARSGAHGHARILPSASARAPMAGRAVAATVASWCSQAGSSRGVEGVGTRCADGFKAIIDQSPARDSARSGRRTSRGRLAAAGPRGRPARARGRPGRRSRASRRGRRGCRRARA